MALDYQILSKKDTVSFPSTFDGSQSVKAIDLLSKTSGEIDIDDYIIVRVEKEYIARPDLISLSIYRTDEFADYICKINGISNPFELNEGNILVCPGLSTLEKLINISPEKNKFVTDDKSEPVITSSKTNKVAPNKKRSPTEATLFDNNYTIYDNINGLVFY